MRFARHFQGLLWLLALGVAASVGAAPYRPQSDQELLETLPRRWADADQRELRQMRAALKAQPRNVELAVQLARRDHAEAAAEGDPRTIGHAQAALAPWWDEAAPPAPVRLMRAVLLQYGHQFDAARADLRAVLQADPSNAEAWAWLAAISLVQADYGTASEACSALATLATPLTAIACSAQVDARTGHGAKAAAALRAALARDPGADAEQRLWALTRLAETEEQLGNAAAAESAYRQALALGLTDAYLLAAYADFLLDQGRAADVLVLLKDRGRSDLLLLRLAQAAQALGRPEAAAWRAELVARFDAGRQRGDVLHQKEESRFALAVLGQPERALALAEANFAMQREPIDARILIEAALAAKNPAAAQPALDWLARSGYDGVPLQRLARASKGGS